MRDECAHPALEFDHVGIVVDRLDTACECWTRMLGRLEWTRTFDDHALGVSVRFARDRSGIVYELIAPLGASSPISSALRSRHNLLNQLAYRTSELTVTTARLRAQGALPIGVPAPALAFGGARVQFLMSPLGFLLEVIEIDRALHEFAG